VRNEEPTASAARSGGGPADRTGAVCVIGAGPAGLAAARALRARGLDYDQVERHTDVGGIWDIDAPGSPMYEAAHFISSKTMSGFSGFPMNDGFPDYPSHRQVLGYLRGFAKHYGLRDRIEFGVSVSAVTKDDDGTWVVHRADGRAARYRGVICCSGAQWTPVMPSVPGSFAGEVMHSSGYRDLDQVRGKRVLVVGGGNSGCDIVVDAGRVAAKAVISMRRGYWIIPKHIFGVPADVFAEGGPTLPAWVQQRVFGRLLRVLYGKPEKLGLQRPDHKLFETHPLLNSNLPLSIQHGDVTARPGLQSASGSTVTFADGTRDDFDLIIFATGYQQSVPYAQAYFSPEQHPDLYLTSFSREHAGLFGVSFIETNSGAYRHFDGAAQMIASYLDDQDRRPPQARQFAAMIAADRPNLSGGIAFDGSARHVGYVDAHALGRYRETVFRRMGWQQRNDPAVAPAVLAPAGDH
jgi:cation diffusion facilitator CzcD-associated flavoprotein CzcO